MKIFSIILLIKENNLHTYHDRPLESLPGIDSLINGTPIWYRKQQIVDYHEKKNKRIRGGGN